MSHEHLLHEVGRYAGAATRAQLRGVSARALDRAVREGIAVRPARGVYVLPSVEAAQHAVVTLRGARSHRTAAMAHGWSVATPPQRPDIIVRRGRNVASDERRGVHLRWRAISSSELDAGVTSPLRTVLDCLRDLPPEDSLPVADSALNSGLVEAPELQRAAQRALGPGARRIRHVAALADGRAANPFESRLRLIAHDVPGLTMCPQVEVVDGWFRARVDLADRVLKVVAEADSFEWHGTRRALAADARRYDLLAVRGWLVLRFAYEHVFGEPDWVRGQLERAVALRQRWCGGSEHCGRALGSVA